MNDYDNHFFMPTHDRNLDEMTKLITLEEIDHLNLAIEEGIVRHDLIKQHIQSDEDTELLAKIQELISPCSSFDFLKEEQEHYTLADAKKIYAR